MNLSLGSGDERKERPVLGGLGDPDTSGTGSLSGVIALAQTASLANVRSVAAAAAGALARRRREILDELDAGPTE